HLEIQTVLDGIALQALLQPVRLVVRGQNDAGAHGRHCSPAAPSGSRPADILCVMPTSPIRIFCGADRSQQLPFKVLAASIRRHASRPVEIRTIDNSLAPPVSDPRFAPYTEFSFARFAIPALCGHQGRALYMDSDMLVFADIAPLFDIDFGPAKVLIRS